MYPVEVSGGMDGTYFRLGRSSSIDTKHVLGRRFFEDLFEVFYRAGIYQSSFSELVHNGLDSTRIFGVMGIIRDVGISRSSCCNTRGSRKPFECPFVVATSLDCITVSMSWTTVVEEDSISIG